MPQYLLRPNSDIKAQWTENPVGNAFDVLDDNVTQPAAPSTAGDQIDSATDGQISSHDFTTTTLAGGETPTTITLWVYAATPAGRAITLALVKSDGGTASLATGSFPAGTAASWRSITFTGAVNQARVDGLQASLTAATGSGTASIYAVYIELNTQTGSGGLLLRGLG